MIMSETRPPNRDIFTISRLNSEVRHVLEGSFPLLWVEGEISNLAQPRSGHLYFSLKDSHAQVRCALFRNKRNLLRFQPASGDHVLVRARISFYEPRGDFQLIIEHMEAAGEGALQRAFEELKQKLEGEGLFASERKRPLPTIPRRLGLITSPSGAAVRDVLQVLARRFPALPVLIYPVRVQGDGAAAEITEALQLANQRGDCDLLILTRGGGSLEDLSAFNDEQLARTVAASRIPVISAVGHEIDFTIADFVADRRAPTPSAAAELATPDQQVLMRQIRQLRERLQRHMHHQLQQCRSRLGNLQLRLRALDPANRLRLNQQRLDELTVRLDRAMRQQLTNRRQRLSALQGRLELLAPTRRIRLVMAQLTALRHRLDQAWRHDQARRRQQLAGLARRLHTVSPLQTLSRGYAIARLPDDGTIVRRASELQVGQAVETLLGEGRIISRVESLLPPSPLHGMKKGE